MFDSATTLVHDGQPTTLRSGDIIVYQIEAKTISINRIGQKGNSIFFCKGQDHDDKLYLGINLTEEDVKALMSNLVKSVSCDHDFIQTKSNLICFLQ